MRLKKILIGLTTGVLALGMLSGCGNSNQPHHHQQASQTSQSSNKQSSNNQNNTGPKVPKKKRTFKNIYVPKMTYHPINNMEADLKPVLDNWSGLYNNPQDAYRGMITKTDTNENPKIVKMPTAIGIVDATKFPTVKLLGVYKIKNKKAVYKGIVITGSKKFKGKVVYTGSNYTDPHKPGQLSDTI